MNHDCPLATQISYSCLTVCIHHTFESQEVSFMYMHIIMKGKVISEPQTHVQFSKTSNIEAKLRLMS